MSLVVWWALRAAHDPKPLDIGLLYRGGQIAWSTGHPERYWAWLGTPLLAVVMAVLTLALRLRTVAVLLTGVNVILVVTTVTVFLVQMRGRVSRRWWWAIAVGLASFGPIMSTVWWKQINLIALCAALLGFALLRGGATHRAAALIGLSVALKPLVVLLPIVLLACRQTRRAGSVALAWVAALTVAAGAVLAFRARDAWLLSPAAELQNFAERTRPGKGFACQTLNFAPSSVLCRLFGPHAWISERILASVAVFALGIGVVAVLRERGVLSWEAFAFACPLSVMASPVEWSHYQVALAPLFVLLIVRFSTEGARRRDWVGLAVAFGLASLTWQPYGSWLQTIADLSSAHPPTHGFRPHDAAWIPWAAQCAQYVLVLTGTAWYSRPAVRGHHLGAEHPHAEPLRRALRSP